MRRIATLFAVLAATARIAGADVWDATDGGPNTSNQLVHGSDQQHDLQSAGGTDQDWFLLSLGAFASYDVVVDATSGAIQTSGLLTLVDEGGNVVQNGSVVGFTNDGTRVLRIVNDGTSDGDQNFVRVTSNCGGSCGTTAVYQIHAHESTAYVPRFNNSASQTTFLQLQNSRAGQNTVSGTIHAFDNAGALLGSQGFTLPALSGLVVNTSTIPGLAGKGGTLRITHNGGYGGVSGKAVSVEPATGFAFDTPVVFRPR